MIPKILHSVWTGGGPMLPQYAECEKSWPVHCPGWEIRHWTDRELVKLPIMNPWLFGLKNPTLQSSLARIEVVRLFGGVYLDSDIELLKPIAPLFEGQTAVISMRNESWLDDCVIAAEPNAEWLLDVCEEFGRRRPKIKYVFDNECPYRDVLDRHPEVSRLPRDVLSAYPPSAEQSAWKTAYAIHHRFSMWMTEDARYMARQAEHRKENVMTPSWLAELAQSGC